MTTLRKRQGMTVVILFVSAVAFLLLMVASSAAQKAGKAAPAASGSPWQVRCQNDGAGMNCRAVQTIVLRKTRKRLLSVRVSRPAAGETAMMITLPHGLYLPAGVSWKIDETKEEQIKVQTCNATGCYAGVPLGSQRIEALKRGGKLIISFENLKKQKVQVPVSLTGFTDAMAKL